MGKILGAIFGFMIGNLIGALVGAFIGHQFDKGMGGIHVSPLSGNKQEAQKLFYKTCFSVMGHICKADGRVSEDEIELAKQIMQRMDLNPDQREEAIELFNQGKQEDFNLQSTMLEFRQTIGFRPNLIRMFLEIQIMTAFADNELHEKEKQILEEVCDLIRFPKQQLEQLIQMIAGMHSQAAANTASSIEDAYKVLGVDEKASANDIKRAYRKLMSQHHPDKLVAKGLPEEMMRVAKEKSQEISKAYEAIKQHKGI